MDYVVVIEQGPNSFGAYVPDLPGCVVAGETREEVMQLIREAIAFHIEGLRADVLPVPPPASATELVLRARAALGVDHGKLDAPGTPPVDRRQL